MVRCNSDPWSLPTYHWWSYRPDLCKLDLRAAKKGSDTKPAVKSDNFKSYLVDNKARSVSPIISKQKAKVDFKKPVPVRFDQKVDLKQPKIDNKQVILDQETLQAKLDKSKLDIEKSMKDLKLKREQSKSIKQKNEEAAAKLKRLRENFNQPGDKSDL
jgi:hypothetical protein